MQVESLISIFSAHFGQIWKISVPIMKRISQIFRNTPYFLSLCHFEGSYSQSKITFRATSFATGDCILSREKISHFKSCVQARPYVINSPFLRPWKILLKMCPWVDHGGGPGVSHGYPRVTSRPSRRDTNRTRETEINGFPNFLHSYPWSFGKTFIKPDGINLFYSLYQVRKFVNMFSEEISGVFVYNGRETKNQNLKGCSTVHLRVYCSNSIFGSFWQLSVLHIWCFQNLIAVEF